MLDYFSFIFLSTQKYSKAKKSSMLEITKSVEWDMGHRIPNHDGQCQYPHGHRYRLEVTLSGTSVTTKDASDEGMVIDFVIFKKILREKIHNILDHRFLAYERDKLLKEAFRGTLEKELKILFVPFIPTSENLVTWCYKELRSEFSQNLRFTRLRLYETPTSFCDYLPE